MSRGKQMTLRGFDDELELRIRKLAQKEGVSLNQAALRLLRKGAGLGEPSERRDVVGTSLDHLFGTWSDKEARAFAKATQDFEAIDPSMWK